MKSRNILIIALIMAVITTVLFRQYLKELDKKYKADQNKVSVVVANQSIGKNQRISKEMLEVKALSSDSVHPEALKKAEDIVGSYALTEIKAGEVLFASRFANQFKEQELVTRKIREGYRAISIEANYVESVSNLIEPEDYIDVTFSEKIKQNDIETIKTEILLENVRVLAVGKRIVENEASNKESKETNAKETNTGETQVIYNSVTLELKPEDIIKIANSDERGNLKFVLRSKVAPK